jgi:mRNA interferase MazF
MNRPARGETWYAELDPVRGHEQAGRRPVLVVSTNLFNYGPADLAVVLPITSREKRIPWHVPLVAAEGGLKMDSFAMCEMVRSISLERLAKRIGKVKATTMAQIEQRLRILLDL